MMNAHGDKITEKMIVRLRKEVSKTPGRRTSAQVVGWLEGIEGGVRLDTRLDRFYCWNVDDLEPTPNRNA